MTDDNLHSVRTLINERAEHTPDKTFLIDTETGRHYSFTDLRHQAQTIADGIAARGVSPGSSVAYAMHNGPHAVFAVLGILYGGYRAVAVNLVAGRDVIAYVLAHSQCALVLTQPACQAMLADSLQCEAFMQSLTHDADSPSLDNEARSPGQTPVLVDVNDECFRYSCDELECMAPVSHDSDGLLMYTSGTTGRPKGVVLSHGNLLAGGQNVAIGHELTADDRALCVLPLYHINGLCVTVFGPLVAGGSVVIPQRFSTSRFWDCVDEYRCSWFSVVPTQIAYLLRDATNHTKATTRPWLRFGRSASAPLSPDVHKSFEQQFSVPLIETMGLTETAAQILTNPMPPGERKFGSPGVPVGDEVIIVDTSLNEVATNTVGELLVRGGNVMQRYFRNPPATAQALIDGGWLRTGDLGHKDSDGYLFITGRLKELIIKGGENIAPREIDDALYRHEDVVEAAAFARPCENYGQRVEAAVALKPQSSLDEAALIALCEQQVGQFKCPDRIHFLVELPKGPSGKIQRQKLPQAVDGVVEH